MIRLHITHRPFIEWRRETLGQKAIGGIALAVSILAGSTFAGFAKHLSTALSPLSLLFVSELLTLFFVLLSFGLIPTIKQLRHMDRTNIIALITIALLTGVVGPFLWFAGISGTTAINSGFFSRMEMVFMLILARIFLGEQLTKAHISAMIAILAGIMTISFQGFTDGLKVLPGDILIVFGALAYGMAHILYRRYLHNIEPQLALFMRSAFAIAIFFIVSPFIEQPFIEEIRSLPSGLIPVLLGFAFISRFLNSISYYEAIDHLAISTVSLLSALTIITSALFAWIYLGEPLYGYHIAGGMFILLGTLLLEILRTRPHIDPQHVEMQLKQRIPH